MEWASRSRVILGLFRTNIHEVWFRYVVSDPVRSPRSLEPPSAFHPTLAEVNLPPESEEGIILNHTQS